MNRYVYWRVVSLMLITIYTQAQSSVEYGYSRIIRIYAPNFKPYDDVAGSPFIPGDSVQQGWLLNGKKQLPARLRYNSYSGEIEYVEGTKILTPMNSVAEFTVLVPDTLHFRKGFPSIDTWAANDFYQILYDGRKTKLVKRIVSVIKSNSDAMDNDFGKKKFEQRETYYLWTPTTKPPSENYFEKLSEGEMKSVFASRKSLLNAFPQQTAIIERYLTDQKLKLKSWAEFASVLKYLETQ